MATPQTRPTVPLAPYNVSLPPFSPLFEYGPARDTDAAQGWNASYIGVASVADGTPTDGTAYRRTRAAGARISLTFEGTGLYLCFDTGGAAFALTLDGQIVQTTTSAANERVCEQADGEANTLLYASGLEYRSHSALLQVAASTEREFRFFGGALEIGVRTGGKTVDDSRTIDDQDSAWILAPGRGGGQWDSMTAQRMFNVTGTFECNYGRDISAAYKFSGAGGAILHGGIWPDSHAFSVQMDDEDPVNLDATSGWEDGGAAFFVAGDLDPAKEHTITIRNFNSDVPDCNRGKFCCVSIDALQLLRAGKEDLPGLPQDPDDDDNSGGQHGPGPESSKKSNTAAIAGGVVGGVAAIAILGVLIFFLLRRRRRRHEDEAYDGQPPMSDEHLARPWVPPQPPMTAHSQVGTSVVLSAAATGTGSGTGPDDHWSPYTSMISSGGVTVPGPVIATGDRKQRNGPGPVYHSVSQSLSQGNISAPSAPSVAGESSTSGLSPSAPRLAQEDLEQVLAFVAQRMDGGGRAHVASVHEPEELPQYRG
ncbi:hypothetical protein AURDEDRAFT_116093 [Auricularia subglabra TFB-10046 SS5]|uniref:Uncharacterized protein n=1 Tax=Auricularia subglabra (strain TFB-10046 / SS5) TaxID=717982 RepID=J0DC13_AURST|nr:hypothetical protein AURDEDRAFT_116093 [Auricularia subglabra TFB-10046 SS5]